MRQKPIFELGKFEQSQKSRKKFYLMILVAMVAIYYIYILINGWGVEVVERKRPKCALVKDFDTPYYESRREGIIELKSKTASLDADTLYVPYPHSGPVSVSIGDNVYVYVPAWAYRCKE